MFTRTEQRPTIQHCALLWRLTREIIQIPKCKPANDDISGKLDMSTIDRTRLRTFQQPRMSLSSNFLGEYIDSGYSGSGYDSFPVSYTEATAGKHSRPTLVVWRDFVTVVFSLESAQSFHANGRTWERVQQIKLSPIKIGVEVQSRLMSMSPCLCVPCHGRIHTKLLKPGQVRYVWNNNTNKHGNIHRSFL